MLSALLAAQGQRPSGPPLLPIEPAGYYAAQTWFAPLVVLGAFVLQVIAARMFRLPPNAALTTAALGVSVPILVFWVCADLAAYSLAGMDGLRAVLRIGVPLALVSVVALVARLAKQHEVSTKRAVLLGVALLVVRGVVFGPFMR